MVMQMDIQEISVCDITPGDNDRKVFDPTELGGLAKSISELGVLQAVTVRPTDDGYELIAGERRWRASQLAGLATVPARLLHADDVLAGEAMLAENMARVELNPLEEAMAYRKALDSGSTVERVAEIAGVGVSRVENRLTLLTLDDGVQQQVASGALGTDAARMVARLSLVNQRRVAAEIVGQGLDWWAVQRLTERVASEEATQDLFDGSSFELSIEEYALDAQANRRCSRKALIGLLHQAAEQLDGEQLGSEIRAALERET